MAPLQSDFPNALLNNQQSGQKIIYKNNLLLFHQI